MRELLIVVLTAVCLMSANAAVLADVATQADTDTVKADMKA